MKKNLREVMISLTLSIALLSALVMSAAPAVEEQASDTPRITIDSTMVANMNDWGNQ